MGVHEFPNMNPPPTSHQRHWLPHVLSFQWYIYVYIATSFPGSTAGKNPPAMQRPGSIPGSGRSSGKGRGYMPQYSWASLVAQMVKNPPEIQETWIQCWDRNIPRRRAGNPLQYFCLENPHGQRSLVDDSLWGGRVRHNWATKYRYSNQYWKIDTVCPFGSKAGKPLERIQIPWNWSLNQLWSKTIACAVWTGHLFFIFMGTTELKEPRQ